MKAYPSKNLYASSNPHATPSFMSPVEAHFKRKVTQSYSSTDNF